MSCPICGYGEILRTQEHVAAVRAVLATIPKGARDREIREALQMHIREIDLPANGHGRKADLRCP